MGEIIGIGTDIEEISRFRGKSREDPVLKKIFTNKELKYCFSKDDPAPSLTARFCAKEALIKAFPEKIFYRNIETDFEKGKPAMRFEGGFEGKIQVSMSHCRDYAVALVIIYI